MCLICAGWPVQGRRWLCRHEPRSIPAPCRLEQLRYRRHGGHDPEASGREPFVIGKPSPVMMRSAAAYMNLTPENVTVIGDTMETDIIGGIYMGFKTILVLSGIADEDELIKYGYRPDLVVGSVNEVEFPLKWWK